MRRDKDLHAEAYSEWKENAADGYIQAQRRAFLNGFETAAKESEQFNLLREWLEQERDKRAEKYKESDDTIHFAMRQAYTDVLVKLHEMGNIPESAEDSED